MNATKTKKDKKLHKKAKADFDRSPLWERFKAKFLNFFFFQKLFIKLFIYVILIGVSFVVLFPFISKIAGSFMSPSDLLNDAVRLIPRNFTFDIYRIIWEEQDYMRAFGNTLFLSLMSAILQTFVCCVIAYGFAKFKFKGRTFLFMLVVLTMLIPHKTLGLSFQLEFQRFDILQFIPLPKVGGFAGFGDALKNTFAHEGGLKDGFYNNFKVVGLIGSINETGIFETLTKFTSDMYKNIIEALTNMGMIKNNAIFLFDSIHVMDVKDFESIYNTWLSSRNNLFSSDGIDFRNTYWPFVILSLTGLAFKNGLYIFLLRQFFMGVPDELEESAYIDGSGVFRTFFKIILPISIPMMITVFLFSFSWTWTDNFYASETMFFSKSGAPYLLTTAGIGIGEVPKRFASLDDYGTIKGTYDTVVRNTGGMMIIAPLIVVYLFGQKYLVQGIERSGLTAD